MISKFFKQTVFWYFLATFPMAFSVAFANSCPPNEAIVLSFGDYLLHGRLQELALQKQNYAWFFEKIMPLFKVADFRTLNLEGPAAAGVDKFGKQQQSVNYFDGNILTSYPMFNYHESSLEAIKFVGFDFVSTANNHSLDRRSLGIDKTIEGLELNKIAYAGTRKKNDLRFESFVKLVNIKNFKVAMISCTEHTNGIPDKEEQVLYCGKHLSQIVKLIQTLKQDRSVDGIMVFPHWGEENQHTPQNHQRSWAKKFIDAGSFAVIGSHPHVIQPMESYQSTNGNEGFIFYSLGNFISGQAKLPQKITVGLLLNLGWDENEQLKVKKVAYIPMYMDRSQLQIFPIEPSIYENKKSPRNTEMSLGDQLLTQILGEKNKLYYSKALNILNNCQF